MARTVQVEPLPKPGNVYSFRTSPTSEFAASDTNRVAVFKIVGIDTRLVVVAVMDGVWSERPSLAEASCCSVLREHRFAHTGREAVFGVNTEWWSFDGLKYVVLLGSTSVSVEEARSAYNVLNFLPGSRMGALSGVNHSAEGEWRWANDRDALVAEHAQVQAKQDAKRAAAEKRYRTRLKNLTWEQLLSETLFERWVASPPFPDTEFTRQARNAVRDACIKLRDLGPKPHKSDARKVLKECVQWFNEADQRAGGVIETEERDDICSVLEEISFLARHKDLSAEIDEWRTW